MTLDFFAQGQNFGNGWQYLTDTQTTSRQDSVTTKKNTFTTTNRSENNGSNASDDDFSRIMESLQKRRSEQQENLKSRKEQRASDTQSSEEKPTLARDPVLFSNAFQTQENSITPSDGSEQDVLDILSALEQRVDIQALLDTQDEISEDDLLNALTVSQTSEEETRGLLSFLLSLQQGDGENENGEESNARLASLIDSLKLLSEDEDAAQLSAENLTPETLASLQDYLQRYIDGKLSKEETEELEQFAAQLVVLQDTKSAQTTGKGEGNPSTKTVHIPQIQITTDEAEKHFSEARYDSRYNGQGRDALQSPSADTENFDELVKASQTRTSDGIIPFKTEQSTVSASERFLQTANALLPNGQNGLPTGSLDNVLQSSTALASAVQTAQSPIQGALTNVITQAQGATHAHPATQLVSATIQKAVKAGEETHIKLKLDPPELGRVDVKMSIDQDNVSKIVLTIEKPETHTMLQKDSAALERALAESGLDVNDGLEFELASDGHDFDDNSRSNEQGKHGSANANNGETENEDLIETSMDWHVDPNTGQMHYNILV